MTNLEEQPITDARMDKNIDYELREKIRNIVGKIDLSSSLIKVADDLYWMFAFHLSSRDAEWEVKCKKREAEAWGKGYTAGHFAISEQKPYFNPYLESEE